MQTGTGNTLHLLQTTNLKPTYCTLYTFIVVMFMFKLLSRVLCSQHVSLLQQAISFILQTCLTHA